MGEIHQIAIKYLWELSCSKQVESDSKQVFVLFSNNVKQLKYSSPPKRWAYEP